MPTFRTLSISLGNLRNAVSAVGVGIVAGKEWFSLDKVVVLHAETAGKKAFVYLEPVTLALSHYCLGLRLGLGEAGVAGLGALPSHHHRAVLTRLPHAGSSHHNNYTPLD